MFKYGSLRKFLIKIFFGLISVIFSIVYLGSLISYNENDPGFKNFTNQDISQGIYNYFGIFGSYLSSYSIIIIGSLSYVVGFFILFEGVKSIFGIINKKYLLRFFLNLFGVFFINIFIYLYGLDRINSGLISIFLFDQINYYVYEKINNPLLTYILSLLIFILGLFLIILSFSIKYKFFEKIFMFVKLIKFIKYLNFITPIWNLLKNKSSKKITKARNEPTIKKKTLI